MKLFFIFLLIASLLSVSGCTDSTDSDGYSSDSGPSASDSSDADSSGIDSSGTGDETPGDSFNEARSYPFVDEPRTVSVEAADGEVRVRVVTVDITSEGQAYPAYTAAPAGDVEEGEGGKEGGYPGVVLLHSFNGFQPGYQEMVDMMAADGYVVVAPQWQTYSLSPPDAEVEALVRSSVEFLQGRNDTNPGKLGLTGFCAGGRYTMLFLPQVKEFRSGVAWYGFPYSNGGETRPKSPADLIVDLEAPMLIIHGSRDQASDISDIYSYAGEMDDVDKYFELKVYQGEPHGFMIEEHGGLSKSFVAQDAYGEMIEFFDRTLV